MTLSTDFTHEIPDAMDFIEFAHHTVLVIAEEAGELCREGFQLFLAGGAFCCLFTFSLIVRDACGRKEWGLPFVLCR
jgi:hypothetical protein